MRKKFLHHGAVQGRLGRWFPGEDFAQETGETERRDRAPEDEDYRGI